MALSLFPGHSEVKLGAMSSRKRKRGSSVLTSLLLFAACGGESLPEPSTGKLVTLPVVVHVIDYSPALIPVSDEKILSQLLVLNEDYRKRNTDHQKTPEEFRHLVADVGIEFRLATIGPNGQPTTGIIRTDGEVTGWDGEYPQDHTPIEELALYFTELGGQDAWPSDQYLNIWIADLSDRTGELGLPGYAQLPGTDPRVDGVVIDPRAFGAVAPLHEHHQLGRTATHEIGHWLNLSHVFATNDDCLSTDHVADTPTAKSSYSDFPTHPRSSCGSNDMFMNFMDYVDDGAMYMFTEGQKERMLEVFGVDGERRALYENSGGE